MRGRRRQRAAKTVLVAVLAGEVAGRWLVEELPPAGHASPREHNGRDVRPGVVAAKLGLALVLAWLASRLVEARQVAAAAERTIGLLTVLRGTVWPIHHLWQTPERGA